MVLVLFPVITIFNFVRFCRLFVVEVVRKLSLFGSHLSFSVFGRFLTLIVITRVLFRILINLVVNKLMLTSLFRSCSLVLIRYFHFIDFNATFPFPSLTALILNHHDFL